MAEKLAFVSNRDVIVRSVKYGRSYEFKKGIPRDDVIPGMHQDLLNHGILPADGAGKVEQREVVVEEPNRVKVVLPPEDGDERNKQILDAMRAIVKRNDSADFSGGGMPRAASVTQITGWRVDTKDVTALWKANRAEFAAG